MPTHTPTEHVASVEVVSWKSAHGAAATGHSSRDMQKRYSHVGTETLQNAIDESPFDTEHHDRQSREH